MCLILSLRSYFLSYLGGQLLPIDVQTQNDYLFAFSKHKSDIMQVLLSRYVNTGDTKCARCGTLPGTFRCRVCHNKQVLCRGCMRTSHHDHPFHWIEHWNGHFFQRAALWQTGLRLPIYGLHPCECLPRELEAINASEAEVNRNFYSATESSPTNTTSEPEAGSPTPQSPAHSVHTPNTQDNDTPAGPLRMNPTIYAELSTLLNSDSRQPLSIDQEEDPGDPDWEDEEDEDVDQDNVAQTIPNQDARGNAFVTIFDSSGVHHLPLVMCRCGSAPIDRVMDCIAMGLFPSSYTRISTLFTQSALDELRLLNLAAKTTPYQYHHYIQRKTSKAFPDSVPNRYRELLRMSRQYRILMREKQAAVHMPHYGLGVHGNSDAEHPGGSLPADPPVPLNVHIGMRQSSNPDAPYKISLFCPACPQPGVNVPVDFINTETGKCVCCGKEGR